MCSTYSRLFSVQRPVASLTSATLLWPMPTAVEEPELPYLWQLPFIWEPIWEQKAHIIENEDIYQLHNSLWYIDIHQGGGQSLSFWIEQFLVLCFFCTSYCEVQNVIQQNKPTESGAAAEFHNPEYEHSGILSGLSKHLSRLSVPGELKAASQSVEMRTLRGDSGNEDNGNEDFVRVSICVN